MRDLARHHPNPSSEEERLFPYDRPIQLISSPSATPSRSALAASIVPPAPTLPKQQRKSASRPVAISASSPSSAIPATAICCARSEEHTSELQSLMRISYAVFCLKKTKL